MQPLGGIRILDLTQLLPGPYATLLLADLGAEVVKVEPPGGDPMRLMPPFLSDGKSARFVALNRGKKSVALNLKDPADHAKLLSLVKTTGALLEGFRPGVMCRLRLDEPSLRALKPDLVYCSLSGYGQNGPYRDRVGHDLNYVGVAGLLSMTGAQQPAIPGVPVADLAGGMFAALRVLAAMWRQRQTGQGCYLDVSLTDSAFHWMLLHVAEAATTGEDPEPQEMPLTGGYPCYNVYQTQDGKWLTLGCLEPRFWEALCRALGLEALIPQQYAQGAQREAVFEQLRRLFRSKPLEAWLRELDPTRIPIGPVHGVCEALADAQVKARAPAAFSPLGPRKAAGLERAPALGEHNGQLLGG